MNFEALDVDYRGQEPQDENDETIGIFNAKLIYIANQTFQLGKKYYDEKLVRETLRSLPKRFEAKALQS